MVDALPEHRFRHTYDCGTFEIFNPLLYHVPWESYEAIIEAFGDRRFRHTYSNGTLEMMAPSEEHEWIKEFLGRVIEMAAFELDISIKSVGSTTQRHHDLLKGLEPDLSYYIKHEPQVRGSSGSVISLPPDLAVEVEITHKVLNRLESYATLGVAEVWHYHEHTVEFFMLGEKGYETIDASRALPPLTAEQVTRFIAMLDDNEENAVIRSLVQWLRK